MFRTLKKSIISFVLLLAFLLTNVSPALASTGTLDTNPEAAITAVEPAPETVSEPVAPDPPPPLEEVKEEPAVIEPVNEVPKESPPPAEVETPTEPIAPAVEKPAPLDPVAEPAKEEPVPAEPVEAPVKTPAPVVEEPEPATPVVEPVIEPTPTAPVKSPAKAPAPVVEKPATAAPVKEPVKAPMLAPSVSEPIISAAAVPFTAGPKYYTSTEAFIALCATFKKFSTNGHTLPERVWVNRVTIDGVSQLRVFLAIKSTHTLDFVEINDVKGLFDAQYQEAGNINNPANGSKVYVDGELLPIIGLNGNTNNTRWTVFSWPLSAFNIGFGEVNTIFVDGIGGGHNVTDELLIQIPTTKLKIMKVWQGGNPPSGTTVKFDIYGMPKDVKIAEKSIIFPATEVIIDVPVSTNTGELYTHYKVVETTGAPGYDSDSPRNSVKTDVNVNSVDCTGNLTFKRHDVTITNTPEPIDIVVEKDWVGGDTLAGEISVLLRRKIGTGGTWVDVSSKPLNSGNSWTATWTNEPRVNASGQTWIYGIVESGVPSGFAAVVSPLTATGTNGDILFTITNTYTSPLADVVANKVWNGGIARPEVTFQLYRKVGAEAGLPVGAAVKLDGIVDANELTAWHYTWKDLPTRRQSDGRLYIYYVVETVVPTNYTADLVDDLTVTNTYNSPLADVVANKVWSGGSLRPEVTFQLYRKVGAEAGSTVGAPVVLNGVVDANELTAWHYTWKDLPTHRQADGLLYIYYVVETVVPTNYTADLVDDLTVTNTYHSPLADVVANKVWNGGSLRPEVTFQLYRKVGAEAGLTVGAPVVLNGVVDANELTAWHYTWKDLPTHREADGLLYIYYVVETVVPMNYTADLVDDLTVTNTYNSPLADVVANKVWSGGSLRPEVTFQLYRKVGAEAGSTVGAPVVLNGVVDANELTAWHYTWKDLPTHRQADGLLYIYYVVETVVPTNYTADLVDDLTVTNTYNSPLADVVANKVWNGGSLRPEVTFQLYRKVGAEAGLTVGAPVVLNGVVDANELTAWHYTWKDLPTHREADGLLYIYYVVETVVPMNYTADLVDDLTVTNTYNSPLADVVANKVWNGGSLRPEVTFQLYRKVGAEAGLTVGAPVVLNGVVDANELTAWHYTWKDLPTHRQTDGLLYIYYVVETVVPMNYTADLVDDLTVTNTYNSPLADVVANKVWIGGSLRPEVTFQLYRKVGAEAGLTVGAPVVLNGVVDANELTAWHYTWKDLPTHRDADGLLYIYYVVETVVPMNYTADLVDDLTVTNTYNSPLADVVANKVWIGGSLRPEVTFQLYRKVGAEAGLTVGTPVVLDGVVDANELTAWHYTWKDLPTHRDADGLFYIYYVVETVVPMNYTADQVDDLTVTNTYSSPLADVVANKVWVNGNDRPAVTFQLYRKIGAEAGLTVGAPVVLDGVVDANELTAWHYTWKDLPTHRDADGLLYTYYVIETVVPTNYDAVADGLTVTNTFNVGSRDIPVEKIWIGGPTVKPQVTINLLADGIEVDQFVMINGVTTHTFTGKPVFNLNGSTIVYTITEDLLPGYITGVNGFTVTNDLDEGLRDIAVNKIWVGGPAAKPVITINLLADGVEVRQVALAGILGYTFTGLPVLNSDGTAINYTITEDPVPGYIPSINGFTVTNDFDEGLQDFTMNKIWIGGPLVKPSITINLMADGVDVDSVVLANGTTEYTFEDVPIYNSDGTTIVYAISENFVPGYISSIDGFTATNDFDEGLRDISVTKVWEGGIGVRPTITINLLADGVEIAQVVLPAGDTEHTFTGLPVFKSDGTTIVYSVTEDPVTDYETVITGFTVFNTWDGELPFTGTNNTTTLPFLGVLMALGGLAMVVRRKRNKI